MSHGLGRLQRNVLEYLNTEPLGLLGNPGCGPAGVAMWHIAAAVHGVETATESQRSATRRAIAGLAAQGLVDVDRQSGPTAFVTRALTAEERKKLIQAHRGSLQGAQLMLKQEEGKLQWHELFAHPWGAKTRASQVEHWRREVAYHEARITALKGR